MNRRHQAYPEYKNSGVASTSKMPSHWIAGKVKYVTESLDKIRVPLSSEERGNRKGEYPYYGASGIIDYVDDYLFDEETILFGEDGANLIARSSPLAFLAKGKYWVNNHAHILKTKDGVNNYWVMCFENIDVTTVVSGSAQPKLTAEALGDLQIVYPPTIPEREIIASFLDQETAKIDTLIEKQQQLIKLLKEKRLAMVDLATEETEQVRLENCSKIMAREIEYSDNDLYTPIGLFNRGRGLFHKDLTLGKNLGDSDFYYIEDNDLIFSGQFAWEGAVALADGEDHGCIASHRYPVVRGVDGILDTTYLWAFFTSQRGDLLMNECSRGAAGRNRPLNISCLMKEKIPVPPMSEQLAISRLVQHERKIEVKVKKVISTLGEKRAALISAIVTGKIDVRKW